MLLATEVLQRVPSNKALHQIARRHQYNVFPERAQRNEASDGHTLEQSASVRLAMLLEEETQEKEKEEGKG